MMLAVSRAKFQPAALTEFAILPRRGCRYGPQQTKEKLLVTGSPDIKYCFTFVVRECHLRTVAHKRLGETR